MFVATTMMAVPAKPGLKKKVTLKDGTRYYGRVVATWR